MNQKDESWLDVVSEVARAFIEENYGDESSLFGVCWEVLSPRLGDLVGGRQDRAFDSRVIHDISFVKGKALDLVTPIVVATVAEACQAVHEKALSASQVEDLVSLTAKKFGAGAELRNCLKRHLPAMCLDAMAVKIHLPITESNELLPEGRLWVERCDDLGRPLDEPSASVGWFEEDQVESMFRSQRDKYDLFVDEQASAIHLPRNGKAVPWRKLQARRKKLLGIILESLRNRRCITHEAIYRRVLAKSPHATYSPVLDYDNVRKVLMGVNDCLHGVFKGVVVAERGMAQYAIEGKMRYCWIRLSNHSSRLLPSDPENA